MNFVVGYGWEAHPEEDPFWSGFETKDMGWDHPYFHTTTMEERAQRARWMKADLEPDAEMPFIIDYINSPLGPDNAIKNAYFGGGFYSGFVIDCDGTIIHTESWAWFAPGGQWWSLPLAPVESLEAFLDAYLADPPPCYDQSSVPPGLRPPRVVEMVSSEQERQPTVLVVDDDGGSAYEGYFKIPLGHLKKHFEVWDIQANRSPTSNMLADYEVVVWFTGDTSQHTLTPTDQANLAAYLDGGGKLFLSGQDIGQDIGHTAFYNDYLHATFIADDTNITRIVGEDILGGIAVWFISGVDGAGNQEAPSQIGLSDGAIGVFRYHYESPGPPAWAGLCWEGDYKVVYFAFGFEGIGDLGAAAFRFKIMKKVFAWLEDWEACCLPDNSCVAADALSCVDDLDGVPGGPDSACEDDVDGDGIIVIAARARVPTSWLAESSAGYRTYLYCIRSTS